MGRQCIELNLPNELDELIRNAINLVRARDPSSRVRENADLFIKVHIVPIKEFIEINDNNVRVKINTEGKLIIKGISIISSNIKPCKPRIKKEYLPLLNIYLTYEVRLLTMFHDYLLCNDALNYLMWAYDNAINGHLINELVNRGIKEKNIIKALNEIFNTIICDLTNYILGIQTYVDHEMLKEVLRKINGSMLIILKLSDDCIYLGLTNLPS
ncbi:hypothetical protein [Vulcanisaeta sp. JCM 14467]|uniref:hypothetical protein n=1 Tax=Vulcanisaeta sp. JCM 14467 TaxID=1295370 RepID=UPI0006D1576B|nr:hypothetical protein [Vulcanisaeta sp. JCM 14467]